jgi:hypothetical protein
MSTDYLYESGVDKSNGDATSDLTRPLVTDITSGLVKALITRKRLELDEECLQNTSSKPGSVY